MPIIYLSPSTQEFNPYITTGNEEEWMNRLADNMEPYLTASGIRYVRNSPSGTAVNAIRESNAGSYDLHLALHSNAALGDLSGKLRGINVYYYPGSPQGERASKLIAEGLKTIYPLPDLVKAEPTTSIGEVGKVSAPSAFIELGYHDNPDDAAWIQNNLDEIARNIVQSLTKYFGIPFFTPQPPRRGVVDVTWGYLNIRSRPDPKAEVIAKAYDGAALSVLNSYNGWYLVRFGDIVGYAASDYITLLAPSS